MCLGSTQKASFQWRYCPHLLTHNPPYFYSMWDFGRTPKKSPLEQSIIESPLKRHPSTHYTQKAPPILRACSYLGQLCLSNRAQPWILGSPLLFAKRGFSPTRLSINLGYDTTRMKPYGSILLHINMIVFS